MNAFEKLAAAKEQADMEQKARENYAAYVADRRQSGWTDADVAEYRAAVADVMQNGTDDDKAAAREFWALKVGEIGRMYAIEMAGQA